MTKICRKSYAVKSKDDDESALNAIGQAKLCEGKLQGPYHKGNKASAINAIGFSQKW